MPDKSVQPRDYTDALTSLLNSLQSLVALQGFQNDVLTQTLKQSETIVCVLDAYFKADMCNAE